MSITVRVGLIRRIGEVISSLDVGMEINFAPDSYDELENMVENMISAFYPGWELEKILA